jgi:ribosomal protein S18 acetylase RimI-like enzyme
MTIDIRLLGPGDDAVLVRVADGVFDHPINPWYASEFLNDPRHHLAVALDDGVVVGFASGVHYIHPDKPPQLFINEVGVAPSYQNQGIGRSVLSALLESGRAAGCTEAWVGTERTNQAAMRLYAAAGGESPEDFVLFTFPLE